MRTMQSLGEVLEFHSNARPDKEAILFLADGEERIENWTFQTLFEESLRYAAGFQQRGIQKGDRVIIMLPTCIEFFPCIYGAFLIGAVPVPVYPPFSFNRLEHYLHTLSEIVTNSGAKLMVSFPEAMQIIGSILTQADQLREICKVSQIPVGMDNVKPTSLKYDDLAMIQYTSGSTSTPKGVTLTYGNILSNIINLGRTVGAVPEEEMGCSWLPVYHDMGLIATIFYCMYWGFPLVMMTPLHFLRKPIRWLRAFSRFRCTQSGAPNFAYELCLRKIPDDQLEGIDLSSWRVAFNGAEPIPKSTLEGFIKRFEPYGFKRKTMYPVYGLAEHTVAVSFMKELEGPRYLTVDSTSLEPGHTVQTKSTGKGSQMVDCISVGSPFAEHVVYIVDSAGHALPEDTVGEIAVSGPSLSIGYFNRPDAFKAQLIKPNGDEREFFRTGDLGFVHKGELYVTGRQKDLIIVRGRNYYPQDIEAIVEKNRHVRKGCTAAFSVNRGMGTESLVIVAETKAKTQEDKEALIAEITTSVSSSLGIVIDDIRLIPPQSIPKTSSGKIQRRATRNLYLEGKLSKNIAVPLWKKGEIILNSAIGFGLFHLRKLLPIQAYKDKNPT